VVFNLDYPLVLLAIPVVIAYVLLTSKKLMKQRSMRKKLAVWFRIALFILIIISLAGPGIKKASDKTTSIFVMDCSDSLGKSIAKAEDFVEKALDYKKASDKVGIVAFGKDSAVESTVTESPVFSKVQSRINANFTDIEDSLKLASSLIPSTDRKRAVLLTDGRENVGNALKQAEILKRKGIVLDIFPIKNSIASEVQLKDVSIPENMHLNENFEINISVKSTVKTSAVLKLYTDRQLTGTRTVELQKGDNNFTFSSTAGKGGFVTYKVVIEPDDDGISGNNSISSYTYVEDIPRILVVQDESGGAAELVKMLNENVKSDISLPENLPQGVEELQKYDAFVIGNVSAERFPEKFLKSLEICIKQQGKGLLVIGGENSYAPGGYYKTVFEQVLPVDMDIKTEEEKPNLGLVLVIDKSGSMSEGQYGVSKVDLAKEAAIRSTEVLDKKDMIGVIAFDDAVQWVVKTQKLDNLKGIQDAIGTVRSGGGTQIVHPLEEAVNSLKNADTKLKHIILLTDGQAEKSGYEALVEDMNKAGITLSTVAVGRQADTQLLGALAAGGKGRFYMTDEFTDIPKIFAKETFLAGKTYLNNRTFTPSLAGYSDIIKGIESIPVLNGYVGTTPKSTAKVVLESDNGDPILATWQYGLGRTVAWTSDAKGMWTSEWLEWSESPRFWKNIVSYILQSRDSGDYVVEGKLENGKGMVDLKMPADEVKEDVSVKAKLTDPSGNEIAADLEPVSPGLYRGSFETGESGVYIANVTVENGNEALRSVSTGISIPYSPEYDIQESDNAEWLEKLALAGGGRILKSPEEVFSGKLSQATGINDITPFLLAFAAIILLLEITLRRLNLPVEKFITPVKSAMNHTISIAASLKSTMQNTVKTAETSSVNSKKHNVERDDTRESSHSDKTDPVVIQEIKVPEKDNEMSSNISALLDKKRKRDKIKF
jgi:Mg-chelatase subunit ChlD